MYGDAGSRPANDIVVVEVAEQSQARVWLIELKDIGKKYKVNTLETEIEEQWVTLDIARKASFRRT